MRHGRHQRADEARDDFIKQVALDAITVVYQGHGTEFLELDITAKGGEQVVFDGGFGAHLETLNIADLLDGAVVLFNMPVLAVLPKELFPSKGRKLFFISQVNCVMARLVFQPCPEQLHVAEILEPNDQPVIGDVQLLHLHPAAFVHGDGAVAFHGEQPT